MKKNLRFLAAIGLLTAALSLSLAACDAGDEDDTAGGDTTAAAPADPADPDATAPGAETEANAPLTEKVTLTFSGLSLTPSTADAGVTSDGNAFVITRPGTYELTGNLSDGQLRIEVPKTERVDLIFNNFVAASSTSAPVYIASADKVVIELASGSVNQLTDARLYRYAKPTDKKPNACLYSNDDMTIKGSGSLTVVGNYNNGIGCSNDLKINGGTITVSAPNNILKGNDSVTIEAGTLALSGGEDAIKTDNEVRTDKGFVLIKGGVQIDIQCSDDALQATQAVTVESGAVITGNAGGDAVNCPGTVNIAEGTMSGLQSVS